MNMQKSMKTPIKSQQKPLQIGNLTEKGRTHQKF